jgi:AraC-like DNA-binding protein
VAWRFTADWVEAATGHLPRGAVIHPAIRRALRFIATRPQHKVSANELAAEIGLSVSRTTHLFREHVGMPLRRYLMWQRVQAAAVRLAKGMAASEVAHEVGFADAAHLTRTLKMMLAIRPRDIQDAGPTIHVCVRQS